MFSISAAFFWPEFVFARVWISAIMLTIAVRIEFAV
jgi:hypothetical protein